jgi:hypothetical protein
MLNTKDDAFICDECGKMDDVVECNDLKWRCEKCWDRWANMHDRCQKCGHIKIDTHVLTELSEGYVYSCQECEGKLCDLSYFEMIQRSY